MHLHAITIGHSHQSICAAYAHRRCTRTRAHLACVYAIDECMLHACTCLCICIVAHQLTLHAHIDIYIYIYIYIYIGICPHLKS